MKLLDTMYIKLVGSQNFKLINLPIKIPPPHINSFSSKEIEFAICFSPNLNLIKTRNNA